MENAVVARPMVYRRPRRTRAALMTWALVLGAVSAIAQTNPRTLPAVTSAPKYLGSFAIPEGLSYGGHTLGLTADGKSLYYTCIHGGRIARLSIPELGGTATVLDPCGGPDVGNALGQPALIGGILHYDGMVYLTSYGSYDAAHAISTSHWSGPSLNAMKGPYAISNSIDPGMVAGYLAVVPAEWRALLGGPVLSGQCCTSIISRSSYGPAAAVFDPADRKKKAKLLQGYPHDERRGFGDYRQPSAVEGYTGSEVFAGGGIPSGTSSLLYAWRGARATTECYGEGTAEPSKHRKPMEKYPDAVWCYDPTNLNKGPHGYPYRWEWLVQSLGDLADVAANKKRPWQIKPVTIPFDEPSLDHQKHMGGMTLDPLTNKVYVCEGCGFVDAGSPKIRVYQVGVAPAATP